MLSYLFYFAALAVGLYWNNKIIYVLFAVLAFQELIKNKKSARDKLFAITVYSIILPDNYSTELFFLLYFAFALMSGDRLRIRKNKYTLFTALFLASAFLSTVINAVPGINILFSIFSFLPFIIFLVMVNNPERYYAQSIAMCIDKIFAIEAIATVINFVLYRPQIWDDWSCGTFKRSGGQQAQLFVIAAYLCIYYYYQFLYNKRDKKNFIKSVIAFVMLLSTDCWMLLLLLVIGIGISYITTLNVKKVVLIMAVIAILPGAAKVAYSVLPDRIMVTINKLITDDSYFKYRFHKAVVYKETFVDIPFQDIKFALLGKGVGYYNSRAALICTGQYVDFYSNYFEPSMSKYTRDYILDYVTLAHSNGGSDYGSVLARPYSSIMALMGECGYLGCILFALAMAALLKNKNLLIKCLIIIWLCFCMAESYFEYTKVLLMLYACLLSMQQVQKITLLGERAHSNTYEQ